ncbi:MBG domain-containing protein [Pontibacter locisalis]|uniref:MBG domain-containing protein n=1 Tax=Pontibacter locisalis TaxID=1719035 RepID=A0ABW5IQX6_9BACT
MNFKLLLNRRFTEHIVYQRALLVTILFLYTALGVQAQNAYTDAGKSLPTVTSDKDDYAPGEVAIITGSGWVLDSLVDIHLEENPTHEHHHGYHDTKVNSDGTWRIEYPIEERHLGVAFTVIVEGKQSVYKGLAYFTDGNSKLAVDEASGLSGGPITLRARLTQQGGSGPAGNGNGIPSKAIKFTLNGVLVGTAETDANGIASLNTSVPSSIFVGTYNYNKAQSTGVEAIFDGDINATSSSPIGYIASNGGAKLTVTYPSQATTLLVSSSIGTYGGTTTLSATLTSNNAGVSGKVISFTLNGSTVGTALTDNSGIATISAVNLDGINAGNYLNGITATFLGDATYTGNSGTSALTISKKAASVVVAAKTKEYGSADPVLTGTLEGFLAGDNVTASYARVAGETVAGGPYAISATLSPAAVLDNYEITNTASALTINQKPITVTANNASKYCGQTIVFTGTEFTVPAGALVNGDNISTVTLTSAGAIYSATAIGSPYPIVASSAVGTGLSNYSISYVDGALSISATAVDASASSKAVRAGLSTELIASISPKVAGVTVRFFINGNSVGSSLTNANGDATLTVSNLVKDVYMVEAVAGGNCSSSIAYLTVYDPDGSFVTGGGWINSPVYDLPYMKTAGKANFGFNAKYKTGKNEVDQVDGNTTFHLQAGDMNFKSSSHAAMSLVISNYKATYTGEGTINGIGAYEFRVIAIDGDIKGAGNPDHFRIRIWEKGKPSAVVYDNLYGTAENVDPSGANTILGGGSVMIHSVIKGNSTSKSVAAESPVTNNLLQESKFYNYPNAFSDRTTIAFSVDQEQSYLLEVYDVKGALVKKVSMGVAEANKHYEFEVDGRNLAEGIYIARLVTGTKAQSIKMILKK